MDDRKELHRKQLGARLREARRRAGYTQQQVADMLGVGRSTIATWETGQNDVDTATLRWFAEKYGISTDELLGVERRGEPDTDRSTTSQPTSDLSERIMRILEDLATHLKEQAEAERLRIERVEAVRAEAEIERERTLSRLLGRVLADDAGARAEGRSGQAATTDEAEAVAGRP